MSMSPKELLQKQREDTHVAEETFHVTHNEVA